MQSDQPDPDELNRILRDLMLRVTRLEQRLDSLSPSPPTTANTNRRVAEPALQSNPSRAFTSSSEILTLAPDLESRIGAHWLNRIGIVAVLIGVSFFLKYAFEAEWIGPGGRIVIGLLAGIAVIVWSEWFRVHQYRFFSFSPIATRHSPLSLTSPLPSAQSSGIFLAVSPPPSAVPIQCASAFPADASP